MRERGITWIYTLLFNSEELRFFVSRWFLSGIYRAFQSMADGEKMGEKSRFVGTKGGIMVRGMGNFRRVRGEILGEYFRE